VWKNSQGKGTKLTRKLCLRHKKIHLLLELDNLEFEKVCLEWLFINKVKALNVAGNRASQSPGIYDVAFDKFVALFSKLGQ